jgi:DNA-binding transcriptional ArsR family regulator
MTNQELGPIFKALADPTRLAVVEHLCQGPAAVSELAAPFEMALPSFMQHLKQLEQSGLVASVKRGRIRTYRLQPETLKTAEGWLHDQLRLWERRLDQLDAHLLKMKREEKS